MKIITIKIKNIIFIVALIKHMIFLARYIYLFSLIKSFCLCFLDLLFFFLLCVIVKSTSNLNKNNGSFFQFYYLYLRLQICEIILFTLLIGNIY